MLRSSFGNWKGTTEKLLILGHQQFKYVWLSILWDKQYVPGTCIIGFITSPKMSKHGLSIYWCVWYVIWYDMIWYDMICVYGTGAALQPGVCGGGAGTAGS